LSSLDSDTIFLDFLNYFPLACFAVFFCYFGGATFSGESSTIILVLVFFLGRRTISLDSDSGSGSGFTTFIGVSLAFIGVISLAFIGVISLTFIGVSFAFDGTVFTGVAFIGVIGFF